MRKTTNWIRFRTHKPSDGDDGVTGAYRIDHPTILGYFFVVIVGQEYGWDHVSVSIQKAHHRRFKRVERCPTWGEMCWIKDQFFEPEEVAFQIHPKKSEYVNCSEYCLHLWRFQGGEFPTPDPLLVGVRPEDNVRSFKEAEKKLNEKYLASVDEKNQPEGSDAGSAEL